jgi:hypothetical protein
MAEPVRIYPLSAEELAKIPPTQASSADERKAALQARHDAQQTYMRVELEEVKRRIAAQNVTVEASWKKEIQGYERSLCHCGELLAILSESEEPLYTKKINDKIVIVKMAIMHATPEYTMFELLMDDGSSHQTLTCKKCAREALKGEMNLEKLYAFDLAKWLGEPGGTQIAARYARRIPVLAVSLDVEEARN